jgi:cytoskeleton protein RodZ
VQFVAKERIKEKFLTETVGEALRQAREARGISLAEAEEATKVRQKFLEALEQDDFGRLPGEVYRRGFLKSYAIFLGLDPEPLLARYRAQQAPAAPPEAAAPAISAPHVPAATPPIRPLARPLGPTTPFNMTIVWVPLLVIALLVASFFLYQRYGQPYSQRLWTLITRATPTPTAVPTPTLVPTPSPTPIPQPTATPAPSPTPTPVGLIVEVRLTEYTWLRVTVDDAVVFEGTMDAGTVRSWAGRNRVAVRSGNAGGTEITVNGVPKGPMGPPGQVVEQVWTRPQ